MTGQSRRRLAAGEAERGGGARDRRSGDHSGGGDHGSEARAHAHPVEHAGGCGGGGARRSRAQGGGRSSASSGSTATAHGEEEEKGEQAQKLTAEATGWSTGSGTSRRRRTGADDLGRPTTKMTAMAAPRGTPACVARRGGSWRRGGAPGHDGEARGRRWLWPRRAAATAALRARGEGEMQGRERNERARERSGAVLGASGEARASRGRARRQLPWRACARCAATTRPVPLARGGGRLASASQLGRATGPIG